MRRLQPRLEALNQLLLRSVMAPLTGIRVIDFTTLLPGPLASLMLVRSGAEVIKIERPPMGDEIRHYQPRFGDTSVSFALLNEGKRSIAIDIKSEDSRSKLMKLIETADVLIEQFRPGVMQRLGLDYATLNQYCPRLIYVSITGYGQAGQNAGEAGHDLNYMAASGLLDLVSDDKGTPSLPPVLTADIAGGTYPAVMNILLALRQRDIDGNGCYIDVSMTDNLFPLGFWAWGQGMAANEWPRRGGERLTGGSPRYQIYRTKDERYLAAAPLEPRFWEQFCELIGLRKELWDDSTSPQKVIRAVQQCIATKTSAEWQKVFNGHDVCCNVVATMEEAVNSNHVRARGLFSHHLQNESNDRLAEIPVPLSTAFQPDEVTTRHYPILGEANVEFGFDPPQV